MRIRNRLIGLSERPYIIAEMSGNHNGSIDRALDIVKAAALAGADAIKLQTYTADTMTLNVDKDEFRINDKNSLWYGRHLYDLYGEAHTPWEWHEPIMSYANSLGLSCFSTPFDESSVDFLEKLNVPAYKISSFENTDVNLIKKVAKTKKPIIVSTGMASLKELQMLVGTLRSEGCNQFVLLKCTSAYPALPSEANLRTLPHLSEMFDCHVGLSDHTMGIGVAIASVSLGAVIIEKHFTLSRAEGGVDAKFSLEPNELKALVDECGKAWECLGKVCYSPGVTESKSKQFRRSIYVSKKMKAGELITAENIRCIRPGFGLEPQHWDFVIGKKIKKDVSPGEALCWNLILDAVD